MSQLKLVFTYDAQNGFARDTDRVVSSIEIWPFSATRKMRPLRLGKIAFSGRADSTTLVITLSLPFRTRALGRMTSPA